MFQFPAFASYTLSFQVKIPFNDTWKPCSCRTPVKRAVFAHAPYRPSGWRCAGAPQKRRRAFALAKPKTSTPLPRHVEDKRGRCEAPQAPPRVAGRPAPRPEDRPEGPRIRRDDQKCWTIFQLKRFSKYQRWVSPFGNPWIKAYSRLPTAYRSVSRPSSPVHAKASTKCP